MKKTTILLMLLTFLAFSCEQQAQVEPKTKKDSENVAMIAPNNCNTQYQEFWSYWGPENMQPRIASISKHKENLLVCYEDDVLQKDTSTLSGSIFYFNIESKQELVRVNYRNEYKNIIDSLTNINYFLGSHMPRYPNASAISDVDNDSVEEIFLFGPVIHRVTPLGELEQISSKIYKNGNQKRIILEDVNNDNLKDIIIFNNNFYEDVSFDVYLQKEDKKFELNFHKEFDSSYIHGFTQIFIGNFIHKNKKSIAISNGDTRKITIYDENGVVEKIMEFQNVTANLKCLHTSDVDEDGFDDFVMRPFRIEGYTGPLLFVFGGDWKEVIFENTYSVDLMTGIQICGDNMLVFYSSLGTELLKVDKNRQVKKESANGLIITNADYIFSKNSNLYRIWKGGSRIRISVQTPF